MTLEDKLVALEDEIRLLNEYCKTKGFTPIQTEEYARPLLEYVHAEQREKWKKKAAILSTILFIVLAVYYVDPTNRLVCAASKLAAIQILPLWDWTRFGNERCALQNPYFVGNIPDEAFCETCESLTTIQRHSNISTNVFMSDFLYRERPVIVTDAINDWHAQKKFSISFLAQIFEQMEVLSQNMPCDFQSNVRVRNNNAGLVLKKAALGEINDWYANWLNCAAGASKLMRHFYSRPYFLPPSTEMERKSSLYVAGQYRGKNEKPVIIAAPMVMFAQLKGSTKMKLTPHHPCNETCPTLYATLHPGEMLVYTDFLWLVDYTPLESPENIALGIGGFFMKN